MKYYAPIKMIFQKSFKLHENCSRYIYYKKSKQFIQSDLHLTLCFKKRNILGRISHAEKGIPGTLNGQPAYMLESHLEGPAWLGREEGAGWRARQGVPASVHTEHSGSTSPRRLLSRYLKAYPGVDQTQGLNQGKVLPHVPTQRLREGGS